MDTNANYAYSSSVMQIAFLHSMQLLLLTVERNTPKDEIEAEERICNQFN